MHNWFSIEVEAESRRQEWERESTAVARASQMAEASQRMRRPAVPRPSPYLASLRFLAAPPAPRGAPRPIEC